MKRSIFKPILGGIIIGAALFFAPFLLLKFIFWMCIIGAILRLIFWRRHSYWGGPHPYTAYADKVRNMSQEDYDAFKTKMNRWQGGCGYYSRHNCYAEKDICEKETKTNL